MPRSLIATSGDGGTTQVIEKPLEKPSEPVEIARFHSADVSSIEAERVGSDEIRLAASQLEIDVPRVWQEFLTEIGRAYLGDMLPSHPSSWKEDQPDHEDLRALDDKLPTRMLAVGTTLSGDWYSLDLEHVSDDGDCPLLKFDHEINQCVDCWPSVGEFINDMLGGQEAG